MNLTHLIEDYLTADGIPENFRGFTYLTKAIELYQFGMYVSRDLYPSIAAIYGTTHGCVERAMRYAISKTTSKRTIGAYIARARMMIERKMEVA